MTLLGECGLGVGRAGSSSCNRSRSERGESMQGTFGSRLGAHTTAKEPRLCLGVPLVCNPDSYHEANVEAGMFPSHTHPTVTRH